MLKPLFRKIFGTRNDRLIKRLSKTVALINSFEETITALSDQALRDKTEDFRSRLAAGTPLDDLLPEAFAVVREASQRALGMRHFDVQMIGGLVLHQGKIAEMRTGEGKTLVATLTVYLNALPGKGVSVVTVNDYLARRDATWMGRIYHFLGMTVGVINSSGGMGPDNASYQFDPAHSGGDGSGYRHLRPITRQEAYACDITYGTNNEYGFDYLRDNMAFSAEQRVQRRPFYAIVDEVDSILIDEARTPLIISGPTDDTSEVYQKVDALIPPLTRQAPFTNEEGKPDFGPGDYAIDEKARQVFLSEEGHEHIEEGLTRLGLLPEGESLYDSAHIVLMHHVNAALRAHAMFSRNVDYIVKDHQIIIVDEFTGRTMPGRRWSEGLHQAVEAKERVPIQNENQTLASITFQNYFRLYPKLAGMTGTADTEAYEFQQIYGLEVVVVPTHRLMIRKDHGDLVFLTQREKYQAILEDIQACVERQQPVLVGTASIETSELVSGILQKAGVTHQVLNAKHHEREAAIVAQAGQPGAVTIATNMAGRGTDIVLGGNLEAEIDQTPEAGHSVLRLDWQTRHDRVIQAGGLHVIGTERHESRRIDNQLRGRSGRQGDPGSSRFYLSLEDSLMRIFASERVSGMMQKLGMEEGEAIEHPWVTRAIENAQRKVEGRNFDIRKQLLEFDDVANDQRRVVYQQRDELMETQDVSQAIATMREDILTQIAAAHIAPGSLEEQWNVVGLGQALAEQFGGDWPIRAWLDEDHDLHEETLHQRLLTLLNQAYAAKEQLVGAEALRHFEKAVMLQTLDGHWKEHLAAMDYLRQGIHLRGYAQKNPKQEYKREAFELFSRMLEAMRQEVVGLLSKLQIRTPDDVAALEPQPSAPMDFEFKHEVFQGFEDPDKPATGDEPGDVPAQPIHPTPYVRHDPKVGRNQPCPCGSGKKYKHCHGQLDQGSA